METILTDELSRILGYAADEAMRTGFMEICPDHIILAIIRDGQNDVFDTLSSLGLDLMEFKNFIESRISRGVMIPYGRKDDIRASRDVQNIMNVAMLEASGSGSKKTGTMQLFSALMKISLCEGRTYLMEMGVNPSVFSVRVETKERKRETRNIPQFIIQTTNKTVC